MAQPIIVVEKIETQKNILKKSTGEKIKTKFKVCMNLVAERIKNVGPINEVPLECDNAGSSKMEIVTD